MSLDELLIEVGDELDRLSSEHEVPVGQISASHRGRRLVGVAAAGALVATGVVATAILRQSDGAVTVSSSPEPTDAPVATSAPPTSLEPVTTPTVLASTVPPSASWPASIKRGSVGEQVTWLQQRLTDLGFAPGPINGMFDETTQQAVWAFKSLIGGMSFRQLNADEHATEVTAEWWARMIEPVTIEPRRPSAATHVEVYLPLQVLAVFTDNRPVLIAHISSGAVDDQGNPVRWCAVVQYDTDDAGNALAEPVVRDECAFAKTPGGVFAFNHRAEGIRLGPLGGMYNPVYFNYGIAIHGARSVPRYPASHGAIRIALEVADVFPGLVHTGDSVYVWGQDGREPEDYTRAESLPSFPSPNPDSTTP